MKKVKKAILIFLAFIGVFALVILLLFWLLLHGHKYHIKTEFGDSFTIKAGVFTDDCCIMDDNSEYMESIIHFEGKKQFKTICHSEYYTCYQVKTDSDNLFILKFPEYNNCFSLCPSNEEYTLFLMKGKQGEIIKSELLCDSNLIELVLPYLDEVYHKEMQEMAKKLTSGDYEELEQYGLTQEMINDKDSLDEKIRIMEDYLNNGGNQNERTAP